MSKSYLMEKHAERIILFVRHGEAPRQKDIYMDEKDVVLSEHGKEQALAVRGSVIRFDAELAVTSTVKRCQQTARLALPEGLPTQTTPKLRERCFPPLFGLSFDFIRDQYGEEAESLLRTCGEKLELPGVENIQEAQSRVLDVINSIDVNRSVIVSHGGPHSWICCAALGLPLSKLRQFQLGTGRFSIFRVYEQQIDIIALNAGPGFPL